MRIKFPFLLLTLLAAPALAAPPAPTMLTPSTAPATLPAIDYSSPTAVYISLQKLLLANDPDAHLKCSIPPTSDAQRDALRALTARTLLSCALADHFGATEAARYTGMDDAPNDLINQARTTQPTIHDDTAELVLLSLHAAARTGRSLTSIKFQRINDHWRIVQLPATITDQQHTIDQSEIESAQRILADLRSGKLRTLSDFQNEQISARRSANRIQPVYQPPNLDPAGLRIKPVAVPADKSDDHAFHVDIVLQNTGPREINVLLGQTNNGSVNFNMNSSMEAIDKNGIPTHIAMQRVFAYRGPPLLPWVITLKPGESFSMRPDIPFAAPKPPPTPARLPPRVPGDPPVRGRPNVTIAPYFLPPGTYTFTATVVSNQVHETRQPGDLFRESTLPKYAQDIAKMPIFTGTVISEPVTITVPIPPPPHNDKSRN